jgi:hypothetical protein
MHNAVLAFQLGVTNSTSIVSLALAADGGGGGGASGQKKKKTRGSVLGDVAFSTSYKLARQSNAYDTVNISNNSVGRGVVAWIRRFDPEGNMRNLIAQNCRLKDADIRRMSTHLTDHRNCKRLDIRGNMFRETASFKALQTLAERNSSIVEILLEDANLSGAPFGAVTAMRKALSKNRRLLHKGEKVGLLSALDVSSPNDDQRCGSELSELAVGAAKRFHSEVGGDDATLQWSGSGIMHGLYVAKKASKCSWADKVKQGKIKRATTRSEIAAAVENRGVQLTLHRPTSMKDLRWTLRHACSLPCLTRTALGP